MPDKNELFIIDPSQKPPLPLGALPDCWINSFPSFISTNDDVVLNNAPFSQLRQLIGESSPIPSNAASSYASVSIAEGANQNMKESQLPEELEDREGLMEG